MLYLDINDVEQLNITFCSLVGIKPIRGILINLDTQEIRTYICASSLYKKPKGWVNVQHILFEEPRYPDFTEINNFYTLLNIQWELFGNLGDQYIRFKDESFPVNYLFTKIKAIQTLKSYGGSDMLDEFIRRVQNSEFIFDIKEEEIGDDEST